MRYMCLYNMQKCADYGSCTATTRSIYEIYIKKESGTGCEKYGALKTQNENCCFCYITGTECIVIAEIIKV